ncbi:TRAP transporter small permease [Paenalcaligenes faecalis]|uniref:TRAP transporter small permease n=1 Tax=Paenalcaligenes faecalis TaxID=2980099 RepID=UPI0022B965D6|nr:TRAP transporter small permease [Paenalcaligenes faecalis]
MRKSLDKLYAVSGAIAALSLVLIVIIVFGQVVLNFIDFIAQKVVGKSYGLLIPSYASFSGYALGFATFLSLGLGIRRAAHIRVTLIEGTLNPRVRRWTLTIVALLGVLMGGLFSWSLGQLSYESWLWGDTATGLIRVPLWIPQSVLTIGSIIFWIATIDTFIEMLRDQQSSALRAVDPVEEGM